MGHNIHNNQNQIWWVTIRECLVFGSIVGPDYYGYSWVLMTMGHNNHNNQNQIWWVTIRECLVFGSIVGPDYYGNGTHM